MGGTWRVVFRFDEQQRESTRVLATGLSRRQADVVAHEYAIQRSSSPHTGEWSIYPEEEV